MHHLPHCRALVALQVIKPTGDTLSIRRAIGYFVDNLARQTERQETIAVRRGSRTARRRYMKRVGDGLGASIWGCAIPQCNVTSGYRIPNAVHLVNKRTAAHDCRR